MAVGAPPPEPAGSGPTARALLTGSGLGVLLGISNLYVGLKVGWSVGVVVIAAVLGWTGWNLAHRVSPRVRPPGPIEASTMVSTASAAGYSTGATLASAASAYALLNGTHIPLAVLMTWVLAVAGLGVCIAAPLRIRLLARERLPFPTGLAAAHMLRTLSRRGRHGAAAKRLLVAAGVGALTAFLVPATGWLAARGWIPRAVPGSWPSPAVAAGMGIAGAVALGWSVELGSVAAAAGALVGPRIACSVFVGAVVCFGGLPWCGAVQGADYRSVAAWTVWPGAALMASGSLGGWAVRRRGDARGAAGAVGSTGGAAPRVPRSWIAGGLLGCGLVAVVLQVRVFSASWAAAVAAVLLACGLAVVAARVTGETDVSPAGPLGKVAQVALGPWTGGATANVMGAAVSAAAAASAADLLTDLKMGQRLGTRPRTQFIAQAVGVVVGAGFVVPAFVKLVVPDPASLGSAQWPAPAAQVWVAFAAAAAHGVAALPSGAGRAVVVAAAAGLVLARLERRWPALACVTPAPAALGVGCVLPPGVAIAMVAGGLASGVGRGGWGQAWVLPVASGLIAGESAAGVVVSLLRAVG